MKGFKYDIIVAADEKNGIGKNGSIPWHNKNDMAFFRRMTTGGTVIMGRITYESIGRLLPNRQNIVITSRTDIIGPEIASSFNDAINLSNKDKVNVIGGGVLYKDTIEEANNIYLTRIKGNYDCDVFFPAIPGWFIEVENIMLDDYTIVYRYLNVKASVCESGEYEYLRLLRKIIRKQPSNNRTRVMTRNIYNKMMSFKIEKVGEDTYAFPSITTKKMYYKGILLELLWFLRGETNTKWLVDRGVHIWDVNTSREYLDSIGLCKYDSGEAGPIYGYQWCNWNGRGINQIKKIIEQLRTTPESRRIVLSAWNVEQLDDMALPPCHMIYVFNVSNGYLYCSMTQRSGDMFLGVPFNISSTAILTILLAKLSGLIPKKISITIANAHIYETHIDSVLEQITRRPLKQPIISVPNIKEYDDILNLEFSDFNIKSNNWGALKSNIVC
jgi:thymidylate synthase